MPFETLRKVSPYWQIVVGLIPILIYAGWLTGRPEARVWLMDVLALFTVGVILYALVFPWKKTDDPPSERDSSTTLLAIIILVFAILFTLFSIDLAGILNVWILVMALFVIFLAVLSIFITGRPMGLFINAQDRMSLATLQTVLWTVILLSAFFTVAAAIIHAGKPEMAFNIALQPELWVLMGISVTTLAGTPLIHSIKSEKPVDQRVLSRYAARNKGRVVGKADQMGELDGVSPADRATRTTDQLFEVVSSDPATLNRVVDELRVGPLALGPCSKDKEQKPASFLDLFRGDEIVDCHRVDLGKVQMFFFTVIGALAYMLVLGDWISTLTPATLAALADAAAASTTVVNATAEAAAATAVVTFPVISGGFIAILGISHAGFLGNTAVPKTPEGNPPA